MCRFQSPLATIDGTIHVLTYAFEHSISKSSDSAPWSSPHARPAAWHACTAMRLGIRIWPRRGEDLQGTDVMLREGPWHILDSGEDLGRGR